MEQIPIENRERLVRLEEKIGTLLVTVDEIKEEVQRTRSRLHMIENDAVAAKAAEHAATAMRAERAALEEARNVGRERWEKRIVMYGGGIVTIVNVGVSLAGKFLH